MLSDLYSVRELKSYNKYLANSEKGVYQIIGNYLGANSSIIKDKLVESDSCDISFTDLEVNTQYQIALGVLKANHIDISEYPNEFIGNPFFDDITWKEILLNKDERVQIHFDEIEDTKVEISIPKIITEVISFNEGFIFNVCCTINEIVIHQKIDVADKKMLLNNFHQTLSHNYNQNKKFLTSEKTDRKSIIDSVQTMNEVYKQILDELPDTGIQYYLNKPTLQIEQTTPYIENKTIQPSKAKESVRNYDNFFSFNNDKYKAEFDTLRDSLVKHNFIKNDTKTPSVKNVFLRSNTSSKVVWVGNKNALHYFINTLADKEIITNKRDRFSVARNIFTDNTGTPQAIKYIKPSDLPKENIQNNLLAIINKSFKEIK